MLKDRSEGMGQPLSPSDPAWPGHYIVPANNRCQGNACQVDTLILPDSLLEKEETLISFRTLQLIKVETLLQPWEIITCPVLCWGSGLVA